MQAIELIPDTNIFIEFAYFTDVDWPKLAGADSVVLLLALPTLKELDEHKAGINQRRRDRATKVLARIRELTQNFKAEGTARPNVIIRLLGVRARREDFGIDLLQVPTKPWPRFGVDGGVAHLKGRGDFISIFVLDLAPGAKTSPQRHLFEEVIYVLEGHGSTTVETHDGRKHSFEWGPMSLFALPLNAKYQHFNASGRERASSRYASPAPAAASSSRPAWASSAPAAPWAR